MSNAAQVEKEITIFAEAKWEAVVAGGDSAGDLLVESIRSKTPVDTQTLQRSVAYEKKRISKWVFKIFTYVEDLSNPRTNASTKSYADCIEYGFICPKNQQRKAFFMFRGGSQESKDKMDALLASFW
jgi:hypothetical protein